MRQVKDIAINPLEHVEPKSKEQQSRESTEKLINGLFAELRAICTAWRQAWPDQSTYDLAKDHWVGGFMDAEINSIEQIEFGLKKQRQSVKPFVPSIGEFIAMCKPAASDFNLPDVNTAYAQAAKLAYPGSDQSMFNQAVYHAACLTGFYELNNLPQDKSFPMFARCYQITVDAIMNGQPLRDVPAPPIMIENKNKGIKTESAKQAAKEAMNKIRGMI